MKKVYNLKTFIVLCVLIVGCLVVGSLYDMQISNVLYNNNDSFAKACAVVGAGFPAGVAVCAAAVMMIVSDNRKFKSVTIIKWIIAIAGAFFGLYTMAGDVLKEGGSIIVLIVELVVLAVFSFLFYLRIRKYDDKKRLVLYSLALFSIVAGGGIVTLILKKFFARPRMRLLISHPLINFTEWYSPDNAQKIKYLAQGIAEGEFKSFPSSHAFFSTCAALLWVIPTFHDKLKGKELLFFIIGIIYSIVLCITRVICGAHFVSDVTIGFAIGIISQFVCYFVYLRYLKN